MKTSRLILMFVLIACAASGHAQDDRSTFRVVGYYSLRAAIDADPTAVPFDKVTHVNLSFLNPDALGNFTQDYSGLAPFFGPELTSPAVTMTYAQITSTFPGSEQVDQWNLPGGKIIYYNGIPTIRRKTSLAKERASGIMIWQMLGDAPGEESLLTAINDVAHGKK